MTRAALDMLVSVINPNIFFMVEESAEPIADHCRQPRATGEARKLKEALLWGIRFLFYGNESFAGT